MKKFLLIYWLPVPLYYAFITYLSGTTPVFPSFYSETANLDKVFHFIEYMFLGIVLARDLFWQRIFHPSTFETRPLGAVNKQVDALSERSESNGPRSGSNSGASSRVVDKSERKEMFAFVFIIGILISADEFHQYFTPNRMMDIFDGIADFMGAAFGLFIFIRFIRGKSYSTATSDDLIALRDKDRRRFGILLVPTIFFMVLTVNVLQLKTPIEARYPLLAFIFDFTEWAFLGYICHRAFYFNAVALRTKALSWFGLIVLGVGLIFSYRYLVTGLDVGKIGYDFLVELGIYYVFGISISFFRRRKIRLQECRRVRDTKVGKKM